MDYYQETIKLWEQYVPKTGQADTVQGELMRAVEKLAMEAVRNQNTTWDESCEILVAYLENHLIDEKLFDEAKLSSLTEALNRIKKHQDPYHDQHFYNLITERIVDYYLHYGSQENIHNPKLLR